MLNVILADDEPLALTLLERMIDWERLGLTLAGRARNGDELFEMLLTERPHIVLTDIQMPGRSGLEIIEKATQNGLDTRFVIVSAYASFEYARQAIQLGAEDFLPKPVSRAELHRTLCAVIKALGGTQSSEMPCSRLIRSAKGYIDAHFDRHLTLEDVAAQVYVSPSYFSTLFKKETGIRFGDYLTGVRMENARRLLADRRFTVAQVAEMVGYRDVKHFSAVFQKTYQMSPAQMRRQA